MRWSIVMASTLVTLLAGIWMSVGSADAGHDRGQKVGVPAYWTPDIPAGVTAFDRLAEATPTVDIAIVNGPEHGPPRPFHPATATAIEKMHAEGVTVIGYVDTGYLGRTGMVTTRVNPGSTEVADWQAQARQDVAAWYDLYGGYGLAGIFFDQALSSCGTDNAFVRAYGQLADVVWDDHDEGFVAINPGTDTEECYTRVSNAIVIFENTYAVYRDWTPPEWVRRHPAGQFWHLVHATPTREQMRDAVALSKQRNAGYVYVTDDTIDATSSPWDRLPAYWREELREIVS